MATYDSLLKVQNNTKDKRYMFAFNSQRWILGPGQLNYLPFDAVTRSMGDPRSGPEAIRIVPDGGGKPFVIPSRLDEIKRLCVLYGTYGDSVDGIHPESKKSLLDEIPDITAWNMEDDTPIVFPHMDPHCTNFLPADTDASQVATLLREMDKMKRQMIAYEEAAKVLGIAGGQTPPKPTEEVDEDSPTPVRPAARRSA